VTRSTHLQSTMHLKRTHSSVLSTQSLRIVTLLSIHLGSQTTYSMGQHVVTSGKYHCVFMYPMPVHGHSSMSLAKASSLLSNISSLGRACFPHGGCLFSRLCNERPVVRAHNVVTRTPRHSCLPLPPSRQLSELRDSSVLKV
jgi:hypothetical protein